MDTATEAVLIPAKETSDGAAVTHSRPRLVALGDSRAQAGAREVCRGSSGGPDRTGSARLRRRASGRGSFVGQSGGWRPPGPTPLSCPQEVRDTVQKRPPEPRVAAGAQTLGNLRQGFMKCLLQVEEEEATRRRAAKARRSPRTLTPAPASAPQSLPPALPQSPASAPAMAPSWARAPAPRGSPGPASGPFAGLDTGWRRAEPWSGDRSLTGTKAR